MTACFHYYESERTDIRAGDSNPPHNHRRAPTPSVRLGHQPKRQDREIVATLTHHKAYAVHEHSNLLYFSTHSLQPLVLFLATLTNALRGAVVESLKTQTKFTTGAMYELA